jgi:hypothetical protein
MELASMLAGEAFTDQPRSVCPALAAILRPYNDVLPDEHRQVLYKYAARVIGTRGGSALTRQRAQSAFAFFCEKLEPGQRLPLTTRLQLRLPGAHLTALSRAAARYARGLDVASHAEALALVDRLIALRDERPGAAFDDTCPYAAEADLSASS